MTDSGGVEARVDHYFDTIRTMARRGSFSGRPGSWVSIGARAGDASCLWRGTRACHPGLHARFLELELWGQILGSVVLPDRHQTLASAVHRVGVEEASADLPNIEPLLDVICPEPHEATGLSACHRPSLDEIRVVVQLQVAEKLGTVSALDSALRATIMLAESVGEDSGTGHPMCEPWPVLTAAHVLARALWETMPACYRRALAHIAQGLFFEVYAREEPEPEFFQQAPEVPLPDGADPLWRFDPAWQYVSVVQRGEDRLDPGPDCWLIEEVEMPLRQGIGVAVKRQRELERRLALLAAGQPLG